MLWANDQTLGFIFLFHFFCFCKFRIGSPVAHGQRGFFEHSAGGGGGTNESTTRPIRSSTLAFDGVDVVQVVESDSFLFVCLFVCLFF